MSELYRELVLNEMALSPCDLREWLKVSPGHVDPIMQLLCDAIIDRQVNNNKAELVIYLTQLIHHY